MNTETRNLSEVIRLAQQRRTLIPVGHTEILNALNALQSAAHAATCNTLPADAAAAFRESLHVIHILLFNLANNNLSLPSAQHKPLFKQAASLRTQLFAALNDYTNEPAPEFEVGSNKQLVSRLAAIHAILKENAELAPVYTCLQPELVKTLSAKDISYHRWHWWSQLLARCDASEQNPNSFVNLLASLNFNKTSFISCLCNTLSAEIEQQISIHEQCKSVSNLMANFETLDATVTGYISAAVSVKQAVLAFLERKWLCLVKMPSQPLSQGSRSAAKLSTVLSVPQLALLIRLMIETKILNETNQTALLKNVAAVIATAKTASLSAESLRVNYYTPNTAAKTILKEYLLQMLRLINSY